MQTTPDLQTAVDALAAALGAANPRGPAVRAAADAVGRAAWTAGHAPADLVAHLAGVLGPLLRARHPGAGGQWLWERALLAVRAGYADAHRGVEPEPAPDASPAAREPAVARPGGAPDGGDAAANAAGADGVGTSPGRRWRTAPTAGQSGVGPAGRAEARGESPGADASVAYDVDAADRIVQVSARWGAFAAANGAPWLASGVVGTSLWDHVTGDETRRLYGAVYATARRWGRAVSLRFRCDAPAERRWMRMTVRPLGRGHLRVTTTLLRRAARPPVALLGPAAEHGAGRVALCSLCMRVRPHGPTAAARQWLDAEALWALAEAPAGADARPLPSAAHEVCADCAADVRAALARATA